MSLKNIYFILVRPQLGENIGFVARAIKNFNITKLRIVNPRCIWPNQKAIATSVGARDIIKSTRVYDSIEKTQWLRQKFLLAYNIRKTTITPKLATEYFFNLEDGVDKLRSTVSVSHPITKKLDFDLAYRIQQEFNVNNPETLFIFEGKLSYDL